MMTSMRKRMGWLAALAAAGTLFGTSCAYDRFGGDFFAPVYGFGSVVDEFFFDVGYYDGGHYDYGCCDYGYYDEDYYDDLEDYYDDLEDYYDDWWD